MKRFGLKAELISIALVATGIVVYPKIRRYVEWHETRTKLMHWSSNLQRENSKVEAYWHIELKFVDSNTGMDFAEKSFAVLTGEPRKTIAADGTVDWGINSNSTPDPKRFFVIPPGKWVDSVDDVIETWDNHTHHSTTQ